MTYFSTIRAGLSGPRLLSAATCLAFVLAAGSPAASESALELRGFTQIGDEYAFSLHDTESGHSEWVWAGQPGEHFDVVDFDAAGRTVTVRYRNRVSTITLERSRIVHIDVPQTPPLPSHTPPTPPPGKEERSSDSGETATRETAPRPSASTGTPGGTREPSGDSGQPSGGFLPGSGNLPPGGGATEPPATPPGSAPDGGDADDDSSDATDPLGSPPPAPESAPPSYTPDHE